MRNALGYWVLLVCLAFGSTPLAFAAGVTASTVNVGGVASALLKGAHPKGAIILLAGGDGSIGVGADGGQSPIAFPCGAVGVSHRDH